MKMMDWQGAQGLQQFADLDSFLVNQKIEIFEELTGIETCNSYQVLGVRGNQPRLGPVLAKESSNFFLRLACGNRRPLTINVAEAPPIITIQRPFRLFPFLQEISVSSGSSNEFLGTVRRSWSGFPFQRNFDIYDSSGALLLRITCPFFSFGWDFTLRGLDDVELGQITKKWAGIMQEEFTDADNFGVSFPKQLPVATKALILGAVFLIDFCFFEDNEVQKKLQRD